jgi:methyl-accepting chemotaxis protein
MQRKTDQEPSWEGAPAATHRIDAVLKQTTTNSFFEAFPAPLVLVDGSDRIEAINHEASILIGEPPHRVIGQSALRYLRLEEGEAAWRRARTTRRGLRDLSAEVRAPAAHAPVRVNMNAIDPARPDVLLVMLRSASRDEAVMRSMREVAGRAAHTAAGLANMGEATTRKAEHIRSVMQGIADGTQVQARKVEETVDVIKDLAKNIDQISNHAVSVSGHIQAQAVTAREGTQVANKAFDRLQVIVEGVENTARSVLDLAQHVEEVEKILDFVDEVARETNLVSLNAAIEAARAGESGRAFAAVADEVKRLAAHTRESLTDTAKLIEAAKAEAAAVQRDTDARVTEVTGSAEHIREALTRFESVARDILESSDLVGQISQATVDQKRSAGAIVAAIDEVAGVAEDATKGTEDAHRMADEVAESMQALTQASHELTSIAESLRSTLERYFESTDRDDTTSGTGA